MFSNRLAVVALAGACILAAGAGGYLASRQHALGARVVRMAPDRARDEIVPTAASA